MNELIKAINVEDSLTRVLTLIQQGVDVNNTADRYGYTALHIAAGKGRPDIVKLLVESGHYIDVKTVYGETPLDIARKFGKNGVADYLVSVLNKKFEQKKKSNKNKTIIVSISFETANETYGSNMALNIQDKYAENRDDRIKLTNRYTTGMIEYPELFSIWAKDMFLSRKKFTADLDKTIAYNKKKYGEGNWVFHKLANLGYILSVVRGFRTVGLLKYMVIRLSIMVVKNPHTTIIISYLRKLVTGGYQKFISHELNLVSVINIGG